MTVTEIVNADSSVDLQSNQVQSEDKEKDIVRLPQETIDKFDQYVTVTDNQYVLNSDVSNKFSKSDILTVKNMLISTNTEIRKSNEIIDPETKEIFATTGSPFLVMAAYNKNYTTKGFWWGKRYYFTSNSAVNKGAKYFRHVSSLRYNDSLFLSALADSIAYASPYATLAGNVASMGVSYVSSQYNGAASALISYNNKHKHNQIYLDMNKTFQYSLHILK